MKIPSTGRSSGEIIEALENYRERDVPWREGRAFGYVFDAKHDALDLGKRAYLMFLSENGLDPTSFPSLLRLENEVVRMCATHVHGDERVVGNFTSGGTESIMLAVKAARDRARVLRPELTRPQMLVPVTAHAAFHKAAHYLDVEIVAFQVDPTTFRADVSAARAAITDRTIMLVGSAPSYAHGVIDPIEALAALAVEHDLWMHVDGCMGGLLLPYLERLGDTVPRFDFRVPGVSSLSMDLHKYGYCPKGASVVLYRDRSLRKHQLYACSEWTGYTIVNATIQSSKSGGPLAGAWATMMRMGDDGYLRIAKEMRDATRRYAEGIDAIPGLRVMAEPDMTLIAFTSDEVPIFVIADLMKKRGWYVQPQLGFAGHRENLHLSITHANVPHVDAFLVDLRACVDEARALPNGDGAMVAGIAQAAASIDPATLDEATFAQLLAAAGTSVGVPEESASINTILQALPRPLTKAILIHYVNQLFA
ncbi:pyridoxal phosphate-dependent decarboxylase family protein [Sandaracinus amylolyticus]|uniref:Pyridoxal-dependent decarboxylase n=1 Tax=Sandaracinus amylolyticus TaxID=927083 RepID=A0A0F6YGB0_9BACT|nr:aspartate aminotransferase family protein [Sandaracinus amylolyticus]AKF03463.1 Pyridoxal-dependent decarboxylase [Sandaracinus amylolyticus]